MLQSVDLILTRRCNLRCAFCYIRQYATEVVPDEVERNLATMQWVVDQYRRGMGSIPPKNRRITLNLYGGEPTMAWESVTALADFAKQCDIPIQLGLVTNMSLMTEDRIDWCIANRVGIHPSIDGCQEAEDFFRITPSGTPVSAAVFANARTLVSKLPGRSCRSTIAPETGKWAAKSVKFLCEDIGFQTVNQVLAGGVDWTDAALEEVKEQTRQITDWWLNCMRDGRYYSLYYLRNMLQGIWQPIRNGRLCSSGTTHACIDVDGTLTPCHRFAGPETQPEYVLGNIHADGITNTALVEQLKSFDANVYHKDRCSRCIAVNSCHALCLHEMMLAGRGMFTPCAHYCKIWPFYYTEAMRAHATMIAEQNELYHKVYRPRKNQPQQPLTQLSHGGTKMPIIGNTLPARTDLTKAQKIAVAKGRIVARVNNLLAQIKASEEAAWKDIWESPDYGPAEILAAFGTDAAELFQISNQVQLLLETLKPGTLDPKVLSAGAPYTLNADGTVTLNA